MIWSTIQIQTTITEFSIISWMIIWSRLYRLCWVIVISCLNYAEQTTKKLLSTNCFWGAFQTRLLLKMANEDSVQRKTEQWIQQRYRIRLIQMPHIATRPVNFTEDMLQTLKKPLIKTDQSWPIISMTRTSILTVNFFKNLYHRWTGLKKKSFLLPMADMQARIILLWQRKRTSN